MSETEAWSRLYTLFCRSLGFRQALYRYDPQLFESFAKEKTNGPQTQ
ncbi:hypothetical protein BSD967_11445 [Bifidobacterium saguini]|uniref:Uncharacterized protein n=1 Tax=Bifidobacterium saguini TaxID=762210 RepID=A0ABX7SC17_9BIFI|nr:hypothetical protein [Bifidobacterium saguini]QTB90815.1 hypothetical protein BSD967_11110 [Bifidobacterium saguini]QTB90877.1 hypothetical protein BSD967_11445 [Bifidobacterium saguini]